MNQTNKFKQLEKNFLINCMNFLILIKKGFISFFRFITSLGNQKVTLMFIPHSEKKVFNFRINLFILFMTFFFGAGLIGCIIFWTVNNYYQSNEIKKETLTNRGNEKKSQELEKMLSEITDAHKIFKSKLSILEDRINSPTIKDLRENENGSGGPENPYPSNMADLSDFDQDKLQYNQLINDYQISIVALSELNKKTEIYNKVISDLPFGSPVNGFYSFSQGFGLRIHPITHQLDFHTGVDLAYQAGTPIVATASGIVVKSEWNEGGYGWYAKIDHKYGFSTLYAHMRSHPIVTPGDKVKKGQVIGYMGSTGASTGNHVHYEVQISNKAVDPWPYVSIY
jgi:murein DD-endopeptidase MepM/ murein hydrolase activator NlpD